MVHSASIKNEKPCYKHMIYSYSPNLREVGLYFKGKEGREKEIIEGEEKERDD